MAAVVADGEAASRREDLRLLLRWRPMAVGGGGGGGGCCVAAVVCDPPARAGTTTSPAAP